MLKMSCPSEEIETTEVTENAPPQPVIDEPPIDVGEAEEKAKRHFEHGLSTLSGITQAD